MKNSTNGAVLHGECLIFPSAIPASAKIFREGGVKDGNPSYVIVADSETTGNHHVIDTFKGVDFFKDGETLFMKNSVPTQVRCVHPDRHNSIDLPAGEWEIGQQMEYDYFTESLRAVRD